MICSVGFTVPKVLEIGNRRHRNQLGFFIEQTAESLHVELAVFGKRHMPQHGTCALGRLLPRDEVRMMFHHRGKHFVARLQIRVAPTACHQIDRCRGALREDALASVLGTNQSAHFFAGLFIKLGAALAQRVDAPMDIGIVAFIDVADRIDHLPRPLRAGRVVQKCQRMARQYVASENRKVIAQRSRQQPILQFAFCILHFSIFP